MRLMRAVMLGAVAMSSMVVVVLPSAAGTMSPCAEPASVRPTIQHVVIVMLENHSYQQVVGNAAAPYQTRLATACGNATQAFGATHTSAANYLATSAGQYPSTSARGCNYSACTSSADNVYQQLDAAGRSWKSYQESMPVPCDKSSAAPYKIGHNPPIFYTGITSAECQTRDIPVPSLTAASGAFYNDLHNGTLPTLAWVTPNTNNDGENPCGGGCALTAADTWLQNFTALLTASTTYKNGSTLVLVTYDEGTGADRSVGENCADKTRDLAGQQPSCHVPLFVLWPYAKPGNNATFFTHYSLTRTVEDLFALPHLAHAADTTTMSLVGAGFGI